MIISNIFYPNMVDQLKVMDWFSTEDILLLYYLSMQTINPKTGRFKYL